MLNNPKDLDSSYKMDLDFGTVWEGKTLSYNRRNLCYLQKVLTMCTCYFDAFDDIKFGTVYFTIIDLCCSEYALLLTCKLHLDQCKTEVNVP